MSFSTHIINDLNEFPAPRIDCMGLEDFIRNYKLTESSESNISSFTKSETVNDQTIIIEIKYNNSLSYQYYYFALYNNAGEPIIRVSSTEWDVFRTLIKYINDKYHILAI